jgi:transposase-like protein
MGRKTYTSGQKVAMVRLLEQRLIDDPTASRREIARELGVDSSQIRKWQQNVDAHVDKATRRNGTRFNPRALSLHPGRQSCLEPLKEELLRFIHEQREEGIPVSVKMVVEFVRPHDAAFRGKSEEAQHQSVRRFVAANGLVHRVHTHQSQKNFNLMKAEALNWIEEARLLVNRDHCFVINMDQTPIFFSMLPRTTLEPIGSTTVNVRTSAGSTMRVTVAVTVTAGGDMLPPLVVFKGQPKGRIAREFQSYPAGAVYTVQTHAWMDESIMNIWIDEILKPYVETKPVGVEPADP